MRSIWRFFFLVIIFFALCFQSLLGEAKPKVSITGEVSEGPLYTYSYTIQNEGTETIHTVGVVVPVNDIENVTTFWDTNHLSQWQGIFELVPFGKHDYWVVALCSERGLYSGEQADGFSYTSLTPPAKVNWGVSTEILPTILKHDTYTWGVTVGPKDITPPVISNVASYRVTGTSAKIRWYTDEETQSQVKYGTTQDYGLNTPLNTKWRTGHEVFLSELLSSTTYHFQIIILPYIQTTG